MPRIAGLKWIRISNHGLLAERFRELRNWHNLLYGRLCNNPQHPSLAPGETQPVGRSEIAVVDSCDDLFPILTGFWIWRQIREETAVDRKKLNWKPWNCRFAKNGLCYIVIPKLLTPLGFENRFLVTGISTPLGEPWAIHSCAKVAWSLGAGSLSMTGWDLGWLPHEVGGLKDFSG